MKARGTVSCLICNGSVEFSLINNFNIIAGVNVLYESDDYHVLLQATKICIKCAGRLHQLFDFNLIKASIDENRVARNENEKTCEFCVDGQPMGQEFVGKVKAAVAGTKWSKTCSAANSCLSCYNFLLLYTEMQEIFEAQKFFFFRRIDSCCIVRVKKCEKDLILKLIEENREVLDDLPEVAAESPDEFESSVEKPREIRKKSKTVKKAARKTKTKKNASNLKLRMRFKNRGSKKSDSEKFILKRLELAASDDILTDTHDKFTAIKLRRSNSSGGSLVSLQEIKAERASSRASTDIAETSCNDLTEKLSAIEQRRTRSYSTNGRRENENLHFGNETPKAVLNRRRRKSRAKGEEEKEESLLDTTLETDLESTENQGKIQESGEISDKTDAKIQKNCEIQKKQQEIYQITGGYRKNSEKKRQNANKKHQKTKKNHQNPAVPHQNPGRTLRRTESIRPKTEIAESYKKNEENSEVLEKTANKIEEKQQKIRKARKSCEKNQHKLKKSLIEAEKNNNLEESQENIGVEQETPDKKPQRARRSLRKSRERQQIDENIQGIVESIQEVKECPEDNVEQPTPPVTKRRGRPSLKKNPVSPVKSPDIVRKLRAKRQKTETESTEACDEAPTPVALDDGILKENFDSERFEEFSAKFLSQTLEGREIDEIVITEGDFDPEIPQIPDSTVAKVQTELPEEPTNAPLNSIENVKEVQGQTKSPPEVKEATPEAVEIFELENFTKALLASRESRDEAGEIQGHTGKLSLNEAPGAVAGANIGVSEESVVETVKVPQENDPKSLESNEVDQNFDEVPGKSVELRSESKKVPQESHENSQKTTEVPPAVLEVPTEVNLDSTEIHQDPPEVRQFPEEIHQDSPELPEDFETLLEAFEVLTKNGKIEEKSCETPSEIKIEKKSCRAPSEIGGIQLQTSHVQQKSPKTPRESIKSSQNSVKSRRTSTRNPQEAPKTPPEVQPSPRKSKKRPRSQQVSLPGPTDALSTSSNLIVPLTASTSDPFISAEQLLLPPRPPSSPTTSFFAESPTPPASPKTYDYYKELFNLRAISITLERTPQGKIDKILSKRTEKPLMVTKSGRIAKQNVVFDPSPKPKEGKKRRGHKRTKVDVSVLDEKIEVDWRQSEEENCVAVEGIIPNEVVMAELHHEVPTNEETGCIKRKYSTNESEEQISPKKPRIAEEAPWMSEDTNSHPKLYGEEKAESQKQESPLKSPMKGYSTDIVEKQMAVAETLTEPNVELEYPEEFPEACEIIEDYVDYSLFNEEGGPLKDTGPSNDVEVVSETPPMTGISSVEVEFLSQSDKDKEKLVVGETRGEYIPEV